MSIGDDQAIKRVAFIGNHVPRRCGIATFTADTRNAVAERGCDCVAVAVNDRPEGYDYPDAVRFTIEQNDIATYRRAAQYLNIQGPDVVSLQHEFGIFGGPAGSHVLALLSELRAPVVTTLHTVLKDPTQDQRRVLKQIAALSDRVIVMSRRGEAFLRDIYGIDRERIDFIHHGIPDMPFADPNFHKDTFGTAGRTVLMTFGLLSPGKGIEHVIRALPLIRERVPDAIYHIVGATHPNLVREQGEAYRESLQQLAGELGVCEALRFDDRFVETDELVRMIGTADIYVTPYLNEAQITSGSLAWAVGAGKPVISTPFWHAQELLADERGVLVPFGDPPAIARAAIELLDDDANRHAMRKRAYTFGRDMTWSSVSRRYCESFQQALADRATQPRAIAQLAAGCGRYELPSVNLRHLHRMTDGTGLLQHATSSVPNYREGYCLDDNARALVLMMHLQECGELVASELDDLTSRYFAFLLHAFNPKTGRFRNFMSHEGRRWLEDSGSEDSHGRAVWALGVVAARARRAEMRDVAARLFGEALPVTRNLAPPRSAAFALFGINAYLHWFTGDRAAAAARQHLARGLVGRFEQASAPDWPWFEDEVTYCNARIPHALLVTGQALGDSEMTRIGLRSLEWLVDLQQADCDHFVPIGCNGFYTRGKRPARFDQQPIEAHATVSACLKAFRDTGNRSWYREARRAFGWFLGQNDLGLPLCDPQTGACCDGLAASSINSNQGAESTLAYLLALVEMRLAERNPATPADLRAAGQRARATLIPSASSPPAYRNRPTVSDSSAFSSTGAT